jgi:hypothetical protein
VVAPHSLVIDSKLQTGHSPSISIPPIAVEDSMSANSFTEPQKRTTLLFPILVGGAVAGTLDQIAAFASSGFNVPRVIGLPIGAARARF